MCAVGGIGESKEVEVGSFTCIENSRPAGESYVLQLVNQRYPKQPKVPIWTSPGLRGSKTGFAENPGGDGQRATNRKTTLPKVPKRLSD